MILLFWTLAFLLSNCVEVVWELRSFQFCRKEMKWIGQEFYVACSYSDPKLWNKFIKLLIVILGDFQKALSKWPLNSFIWKTKKTKQNVYCIHFCTAWNILFLLLKFYQFCFKITLQWQKAAMIEND